MSSTTWVPNVTQDPVFRWSDHLLLLYRHEAFCPIGYYVIVHTEQQQHFCCKGFAANKYADIINDASYHRKYFVFFYFVEGQHRPADMTNFISSPCPTGNRYNKMIFDTMYYTRYYTIYATEVTPGVSTKEMKHARDIGSVR